MLLASPWSTLFHHALVVLETLPRSSRGVGAGREAPRNGQSQLLSSGLFVSVVFPRLRAALLAVVSLSRDSSFGPHRREGDVEQKGTMLTLVCVIFLCCLFLSWKEVTSSQKNGERELQTQGTVQQLMLLYEPNIWEFVSWKLGGWPAFYIEFPQQIPEVCLPTFILASVDPVF